MRNFLQPPFLPEASAETAGLAAITSWPVWLAGGPGAGAYHVARALHLGGDPAGFISVRRLLADPDDLERRVRAALDADPALDALALYVERIERQPAAVQESCLRWIDEGIRRSGRTLEVRVFAQSDATDVARVRGLLPDLAARLSALVIVLPGLAERHEEAPALARLLADDAAGRVGHPSRRPDDAALERLAATASTLEELETSIVRAMFTSGPGAARAATPVAESRGADEPLGSDAPPRSGRTATEARPAAQPGPAPDLPRPTADGVPAYSLDTLITELAHELKNPMVTIKTFAQHLDHLLEDPDLREKFSRLTNEAIDRMDSFLDELLQFSRFGEPTPQPLLVRELLQHAIAALDPSIRDQIRLNGLPSDVRLRADADQIGFAFRALVRGFSRELPADAGIVLESPAPGKLVFQATGAGGTRKLQTLLYPENDTEGETSLHFALAVALIRRNGGHCRIVRGADSLEARLSLPVSERS